MPAEIFFVEDDDIVAELVVFLLEREGYQVAHHSDGRAALAHIATAPAPALALLDVMLPQASGHEVVQRIRARDDWKNVPIIMLTAKAGDGDVARALDAGADDYVVKPFAPDELIARVRRLLKA